MSWFYRATSSRLLSITVLSTGNSLLYSQWFLLCCFNGAYVSASTYSLPFAHSSYSVPDTDTGCAAISISGRSATTNCHHVPKLAFLKVHIYSAVQKILENLTLFSNSWLKQFFDYLISSWVFHPNLVSISRRFTWNTTMRFYGAVSGRKWLLPWCVLRFSLSQWSRCYRILWPNCIRVIVLPTAGKNNS